MKPEYFPPREDIILQNEAPTDLYILVTGSVELIQLKNGVEQAVGALKTGDVFGEIGVLCYRPQLFTVRTKHLSQLLRLNRTSLLNLVQANVGDGTVIMNNLLQRLKEQKDPLTQAILAETEHMLAHGRMDVPLSLCFAATRGDDLLLNHLLRRGTDPNELDSNGRTALHIGAALGSLQSVALLLDYGADPNKKDSEGNVPLWDAILGGHEPVIKLLEENGARLSTGDVGNFVSLAVEQGNMELLKEIIKHGGDITLLNSSGTTALHTAISEENAEIVKFLLEHGTDAEKPDAHGWSPLALADYQGNDEIKSLFRTGEENPDQRVKFTVTEGVPYIKKHQSEPVIHPSTREASFQGFREDGASSTRLRRRASNFQNSLFGVMSAANRSVNAATGNGIPQSSFSSMNLPSRARVVISCPERGSTTEILVLLPDSIEELLDIGFMRFGFHPTQVLTKEGALVEDHAAIRDGDHLLLVSNGAPKNT